MLCLPQIVSQPEPMLMHCGHKVPCMVLCQGLAAGSGSHWIRSFHFYILGASLAKHISVCAPTARLCK